MRILDTSREKYNKTKKLRKTCYFCDNKIIKKQECTKFNFQHWLVLVNKYPYLNGNVMLIPKKHKTKLSALSKAEWDEFSIAVTTVQLELSRVFSTKSFNIGLNEGKDSGRSVDHLHWQILPRWKKNHTVIGVIADIESITLSPDKLKEMLS